MNKIRFQPYLNRVCFGSSTTFEIIYKAGHTAFIHSVVGYNFDKEYLIVYSTRYPTDSSAKIRREDILFFRVITEYYI